MRRASLQSDEETRLRLRELAGLRRLTMQECLRQLVADALRRELRGWQPAAEERR